MLLVWPSGDHGRDCADALRRDVAPLVLLIVSGEFNEHSVVDVGTKARFDCFQVWTVAVACQLHAIAKAWREIGNKLVGVDALREPSITQGTSFVSALAGDMARRPFRYRALGRWRPSRACAREAVLGTLRVAGFPAWALWLLVHLMTLTGFKNRLSVLFQLNGPVPRPEDAPSASSPRSRYSHDTRSTHTRVRARLFTAVHGDGGTMGRGPR